MDVVDEEPIASDVVVDVVEEEPPDGVVVVVVVEVVEESQKPGPYKVLQELPLHLFSLFTCCQLDPL